MDVSYVIFEKKSLDFDQLFKQGWNESTKNWIRIRIHESRLFFGFESDSNIIHYFWIRIGFESIGEFMDSNPTNPRFYFFLSFLFVDWIRIQRIRVFFSETIENETKYDNNLKKNESVESAKKIRIISRILH